MYFLGFTEFDTMKTAEIFEKHSVEPKDLQCMTQAKLKNMGIDDESVFLIHEFILNKGI